MLLVQYPDRLMASPEFSQFQAAIDNTVAALRTAYDDAAKQLNVETATAEGLKIWEAALGLATDVSKSDTARREAIKAKLRGSGTVTAAMLANVAQSFAGGEVTVEEDNANASFKVKFSGQFGVPADIAAVSAALDDIKPAHLAYTYEYSYFLISDIHNVMTISELQTMTLNKFAGGTA